MNISLVIPAYNEEKYIGECLQKISQYKSKFFEIIIINNASTDRTREIALGFPGVQVIDEPKKGLTMARQCALEHARGDIIAFIDADTLMPSGWVEKIIRAYSKDSKIVCVSGPYIYYDSSMILKVGVWIYWIFFAWPTYFFTGYMAVGGNFAAKRSALIAIGGFDTSISFYGEDTDIARRLSKVGKVKFLQKLYMYTSARRLKDEGIFITAYRYVTNFFSVVFKSKPSIEDYKDIR